MAVAGALFGVGVIDGQVSRRDLKETNITMKWEYKVVEVGKSKGLLFQSKELKADDLNSLGEDGWELVTAISVGGSAPGFGTKAQPDQVFFIFKRQKA